MLSSMLLILKDWDKKYDRHSKLQHVYFFGSIAVLIVAGLISLVNYRLGQSLLFLSILMLLVFMLNFVVFALAEALIISKIKKISKKSK